MKKKLLVVAGGLVAVLLLVVVAVALLVDPQAWVDAKKAEIARATSERLGRELTVGSVEASVWKGPGATVRNVRLAGPGKNDLPQLAVGTVEVRLSLWRALLTLGRELPVRRVEIRDLEVRAARDGEGRWDFQDVLDRLAATAPPPSVEDTPSTGPGMLANVRLARFEIVNGMVRIDDAKLGRPLALEGIALGLDDVALGGALKASLDATLVDGKRRSDLRVRAALDELPADLVFDPMPGLELELALGEVDLAPWGNLLPASVLAPAAGTARADLRLTATDALAKVDAKGELALAGVVLRHGASRGKPLDLEAAIDASADAAAPAYRITALTLKGTGIGGGGRLESKGTSPADLVAADLSLTVADLERVLAVLPAGAGLVPPELALGGPFTASVKADAAQVHVAADLDRARVAWGTSFDKPAGRPLRLVLSGTRAADVLEVRTFALTLDTATLGGTMRLPGAAGAPFSANVKTGPVSLASLRDVVPPFRQALAAGRPVKGTFQAILSAKDVGGKQEAAASIAFDGLDVQVEGARAAGGGRVEAQVSPSAEKTSLSIEADFSRMALASTGPDGAKVLDKPAGMPLKIDVDATRTPSRLDLATAFATIGATRIEAKGHAAGLDGAAPALDLDFGTLDVAFDDLRRALPGAAALPPGGRLRGALKVGGSPASLSTVRVAMTGLDFAAEGTHLRGTLSLEDLDRPRFAFDLAGESLDVDRLLGVPPPADEPAPVPPENPHGLPASTRAMLARVSGTGKIAVDRAVVKGIPMTKFVGALTMKNGVVRFDTLEFGSYGGKVTASGTTFDLPAEHLAYRLAMKVERLDLGAALAAHTKVGPAFRGKADHQLDLAGRGLAPADLASTLRGPMELQTEELALSTLDVPGAILARVRSQGGPAASAVSSNGATSTASAATSSSSASSSGSSSGTTLKNVAAKMRFDQGKLRLREPLSTPASFGSLVADGHAFLDRRLDFTATANLSPETVVGWTAGRVRPTAPIPVPLKIGGTWNRPAITGIDTKTLVGALAVGGIAAAAGAAGVDPAEAKAAAERAEAQAREAAAQAEAQARAELDRQRQAAEDARKKTEAEARRRAEEARRKAEAEAKRRAEEAKRKAEEEAKKRLEEAFGGGG